MPNIARLKEGYQRFHEQYFRDDPALYDMLAQKGQSPQTLVIACSDSRVDPALLFDVLPGELFVMRNVANLVPPCESEDTGYHGVSAAIEFAVRQLRVKDIVILGHSDCAGIRALLKKTSSHEHASDFIGNWIDIARDARDRVVEAHGGEFAHSECQHACEKEAIMLSLDNLLSFPWIREAVEAEKLTLHGWYFQLSEGVVLRYDQKEKAFAALV